MSPTRIVVALLYFTTLLHAAPLELDILRQQHDKLVVEPYETGKSDLAAKFSTALDNAITAAKQGGRLEEVLALQLDQKRLAENLPFPEDDEKTPESVKRLRAIYREQVAQLEARRAVTHAEILPAYTKKLQELEATLTKADRIPDALLVKQHRDSLAAGLVSAPVVMAPTTATPAPADGTAAPAVAIPKGKGDDRKAAEWVLSVGGQIEIWENQIKFRKISSSADLPPGELSLKAVLLDNNKGAIRQPIVDADLQVLAGLERLELVVMQKLEITPAAFDVFQSCPSLNQVTLQYNLLGDALWPRLANLPGLKVVNQGYDQLPVTGTGISRLNPKTLNVLGLTSSPIEDAALVEIGQFGNLTKLHLEDSRISDVGMLSLSSLKKLTVFTVQGTNVGLAGLAAIRESPLELLGYGKTLEDFVAWLPDVVTLFPKLEALHFPRDTNPTTADWEQVAAAAPKLNSIYVRSFKFVDGACEGVALMPNLERLELQYCPITDLGIGHLSKAKNLRVLSIKDAIISDAALETLAEMKKLKVVFLPNPANALTAAGIAELKKRRPDIELR